MLIKDKIYIILCSLFSVIIVIGNLTYQKFTKLPFPFYTFEISAGAILYPLTFLITDLIAEIYDKEKAKFCVRVSIIMNIIAAGIIMFMNNLEATSWSKIDNLLFTQVFGFFSIAFIGSIIAAYVAQSIDIILYLWIKRITKDKYLWLRNNLSTTISLFIDTALVISFMTFFGALPIEQMKSLIFNSYLYKIVFTILCTPIFYACVYGVRFLIKYKN